MYYAKQKNNLEKFIVDILLLIVVMILLQAQINKWKAEDVSIEEAYLTVVEEKSETAIQEPQEELVISQDNEVREKPRSSSEPVSLEDMIREEFGPEADIAIAVARAESGLRADCIGDTHLSKPSVGLFQISQIYHGYTTEELQDPVKNIKIAREISSKGRGWENWTTYREGTYKNYLK